MRSVVARFVAAIVDPAIEPTLMAEESVGGDMDQPVFRPQLKVFVAVNVAPPEPVMLVMLPQVNVTVPLGTDRVAGATPLIPSAIGEDCVPVNVQEPLTVVVALADNTIDHPELTAMLLKVLAFVNEIIP